MRITIYLLFSGLALLGCRSLSSQVTTVTGNTKGKELKEVSLSRVESGKLKIVEKVQVGDDHTFRFEFTPEREGFYVLNGGKETGERYLYVKPGDQVAVETDGRKFRLAGNKNSIENRQFEEWMDKSVDVENKSLHSLQYKTSWQDFFPQLESYWTVSDQYMAHLKGSDTFKQLMKKYMECRRDMCAIVYIHSPKATDAHPKPENYPSLYTEMLYPEMFADTTLLELPFFADFTKRYLTYALIADKQFDLRMETALAYVPNDRVKAEVFMLMSQGKRTYFEAEQAFNQYQDILNEQQKEEYLKRLEKLKAQQAANPVITFSYPDSKGKKHALSDYKGKVVVLDFWATWCGPCQHEIPFLMKLEEEMKGQEVVFIGISVDKPKDLEKWKKMVITRKMAEPQLFSSNEGTVFKDYKINSIPRFMIVNREGKVVEATAPKPSDPALKQLIEAELKK